MFWDYTKSWLQNWKIIIVLDFNSEVLWCVVFEF